MGFLGREFDSRRLHQTNNFKGESIMLSVFKIIAIVILGLGVLTALGFAVSFVVVASTKEKDKTEKAKKVEPYKAPKEEVNEIDLDQMLAKLEEASREKEKKAEVEKVQEPVVQPEEKEDIFNFFTIKEEPVQEPVKEEKEEEVRVEEIKVEEVKAEPVQAVVVEPVAQAEPADVVVQVAPEFDYRIRLEKIKESQAKIDRDLDKTSRAILKYERTIRRMERNQKMLDRRALELTNLNLLMYSVTDIKNVDAEKKARQEELTAHIAELKASIQDAQDYIEANKEKYESNLKLKDYLTHEQTRYADEVKELEDLIASGKFFDDGADTTGENK